jgi:serine-type D-Ala-D-Ala carboxypeptidase (penicillin-binding protein 5/6)
VRARLAILVTGLLLTAPAFASPPPVGGRSYYVENSVTGEVLATYKARERLPIASITKLMTVLVALDHARLDDVVTVTKQAARVGGSTIGLRPGEQITVGALIEGALIPSANDAAVALADYVGGGSQSAFVRLMNEKAQEFGLDDTHFVNPDGLDAAGHYSSARDVTRLAEIAMRNPVVGGDVRQKTAAISGGRVLHTRNDLLYSFPNLLGVKTGHTSLAGWSEVAAAAGRGVRIYATLLGEPTRRARNVDLAALLAWGLSRYRVAPVVSTDRIYAWARAPYGRAQLALVPPRSLLRVVRVDRTLVERVVAPGTVSLPVDHGQRLGEVSVFAGKRLVARAPLVASRSIRKPGLIARAEWFAGRTFHHAWSWVT